jgi:hypothetical protein
MKLVTTLVVIALLALMAGALWYLFDSLRVVDFESMPGWMIAAMIGGTLFSLLVGCGLMALMFYSSRHGYDERASGSDHLD